MILVYSLMSHEVFTKKISSSIMLLWATSVLIVGYGRQKMHSGV